MSQTNAELIEYYRTRHRATSCQTVNVLDLCDRLEDADAENAKLKENIKKLWCGIWIATPEEFGDEIDSMEETAKEAELLSGWRMRGCGMTRKRCDC